MDQSRLSFSRQSRKSDRGRLQGLIPGRLASAVSVTIAVAAVGLLAGCGCSSNSSGLAATKTQAATTAPAANSGSSAAPAPAGSSTAPSSATSSPAPADTAGNGTLEGSYTFNITNTYEAPLGPAQPTQSNIVSVSSGGTCDLIYNGLLGSCNQEKIISLPSGSTPTYTACTTGTIYVPNVSPVQGAAFCIEETSGRVAGITVASVGTSSSYVSLKVIVWQYVAPAT